MFINVFISAIHTCVRAAQNITAILAVTIGLGLVTANTASADNFQLAVYNDSPETVVIREVSYKIGSGWWERFLVLNEPRSFGPGDCAAYTTYPYVSGSGFWDPDLTKSIL